MTDPPQGLLTMIDELGDWGHTGRRTLLVYFTIQAWVGFDFLAVQCGSCPMSFVNTTKPSI
jgi:hypothetical protein